MWYRWNGARKEEVTCWSSISCAECVAYSFALGFNLETLCSIPEFSSLLSLFGLIWISFDFVVVFFFHQFDSFLHKTAENYFSNFNKHVSKQISSLFRLFCFLPHIQSLTQMSSSRMVIYFLLNGRSYVAEANPIGYFTSLLRHPLDCLSPDFAGLRLDFLGTFTEITLEIGQSSTWSLFQSEFS